MYDPPHPGEILKQLCLEPMGLSITEAAEAIGVNRKTLSAILNGRAGISPEMTIQLSLAFDTSAESYSISKHNTICGRQDGIRRSLRLGDW